MSEDIREICAATDWGYENNGETPHVYGVCQLPKDHTERYHREMRDGKVWAQWSGDDGPIPRVTK